MTLARVAKGVGFWGFFLWIVVFFCWLVPSSNTLVAVRVLDDLFVALLACFGCILMIIGSRWLDKRGLKRLGEDEWMSRCTELEDHVKHKLHMVFILKVDRWMEVLVPHFTRWFRVEVPMEKKDIFWFTRAGSVLRPWWKRKAYFDLRKLVIRETEAPRLPTELYWVSFTGTYEEL